MAKKRMRAAIGARLRKARVDARLNQEDVAEEMMCTRQCVSSWESGRTLPTLEQFSELSMRYGVSADLILHGVDSVSAAGEMILGRVQAAARDAMAAAQPDAAT